MTQRRVATLGVLLGIFLAGIEGTVVSVAMPTVVQSLGGLALYSWVFAAYMLFAAVSMPIWGSLSDIYGRRRLFVIGVACFVAGSVLSGLSQSMVQLVAFRALQGVGGGAMFAIPYTILGVITPPEHRAKAMGLGSAVWGISSVVGPLLGFLLVATMGWRWVFYVALPVGAAAVWLVVRAMDESKGRQVERVDFAGAAALTVGVGAALLALQLVEGGGADWRAVAAALVGAGGLAAFIRVERRATDPLLPLGMFRDRVFTTTNAVGFLTSFAIFSAIAYVPLFVQSAGSGAGGTAALPGVGHLLAGLPPSAGAAVAIFPVAIGWSGTSMAVGRLVRQGAERAWVVGGAGLLLASFAAATQWTAATPLALILANVFFMGVGMGGVTIPLLTSIQNHYGAEKMGLATSSQQFFRNLGGAVGVALTGFVLTAAMRQRLRATGVDGLGELRRTLLSEGGAAPELVPVLLQGLTWAFAVATAACALAVAVGAAMPRPAAVAGEAAAAEAEADAEA